MRSSLLLLAASSALAAAAPFSDSHYHHARSRPHKTTGGHLSAHVDLPPAMTRLLVARNGGDKPLLSSNRRKGVKAMASTLPLVDLSIPFLTTPKHVVLPRRYNDDDYGDSSSGGYGDSSGMGNGRAHSMASYDPDADDQQGGAADDDGDDADDSPSRRRPSGNNFASSSSPDEDEDTPSLRKSSSLAPAADDEDAPPPSRKTNSFRTSGAASNGGDEEEEEDDDAAPVKPTRSSSVADHTPAPRKSAKASSLADDGDVRALKAHRPASASTDDDLAASPLPSPSSRAHSFAKAGSSADCSALQQLYADMGGAGWTHADGWTGDDDCCLAYGVGCAGGRVRTLDLARNGLVGNLSSAVFSLEALTRLNMSDSAISGPLPDRFDSLPKLDEIELSDNQLSGPLPPTLIALGSLKTVYLRNNSLTGQLAFTGGALSTLIVSRNQFWSMDLSANTELTRVSLDDNPISGWLPPAANVSQLRVFTAARCNFTGPAFNLTELPNLTRLNLQRNQLTGPMPDPTGLVNLEYYAIDGNAGWTGDFPTGLAPSFLHTCHVGAVPSANCPSPTVLADPLSLAAKCSLACRGGGTQLSADSAPPSAAALSETPARVSDTMPRAYLAKTARGGAQRRSRARSSSLAASAIAVGAGALL